jgi:hypothetical protein
VACIGAQWAKEGLFFLALSRKHLLPALGVTWVDGRELVGR